MEMKIVLLLFPLYRSGKKVQRDERTFPGACKWWRLDKPSSLSGFRACILPSEYLSEGLEVVRILMLKLIITSTYLALTAVSLPGAIMNFK